MAKDVEKFEGILNSLLDWKVRQALEQDVKKINLEDYGKKKKIVDSLKKELIQMYSELEEPKENKKENKQ